MSKMDRDLFRRWEHIVDDVDKTKIPVQFIKKLVLKLTGRRQKTINISSLIKQGLEEDEVEEVIGRQLHELDSDITHIEFILDVQRIADEVQPEADKLLNRL
jgi:hypothetical protein